LDVIDGETGSRSASPHCFPSPKRQIKAAIQFDLQQYASNGSTADLLPFMNLIVGQQATYLSA
jgi:hypothetical protein